MTGLEEQLVRIADCNEDQLGIAAKLEVTTKANAEVRKCVQLPSGGQD